MTTEQSEIRIRPGTRDDAAHLTVMVDLASEGMASHTWRDQVGVAESPLGFGRARVLREQADFSYRNATMAETQGGIAGGMVGFVHGDDPPDPAAPPEVQSLLELGALIVGFWYVNILAVYPEYRGRGVGSRLLHEAERRAKAAEAQGLALIVASGNEVAYRLYRRHGYVLTDRRPAATWPKSRIGQEWHLLTKPTSGA